MVVLKTLQMSNATNATAAPLLARLAVLIALVVPGPAVHRPMDAWIPGK